MSNTPDAGSRPVPAVVLHGFSAIPSALVADPGISNAELRVLLALVAHAGPDNTCWPGVPRIARIVHVGERQARRVLKDLVKKGYVEKKLRRRDDGACTSNVYRLRFARWGNDDQEEGGGESETSGGDPGGEELGSADHTEDLDKNDRGGGSKSQGAPVIDDTLTLSIEPGHLATPQSPPLTGGLSADSVSVVQQPGNLRLTRKEQARLEVLEKALAVKATCADCGNSIRPVRGRDEFGRYAPGVAWYEGRGYVHTGCVSEPPTVYWVSHAVGRDGFKTKRLLVRS